MPLLFDGNWPIATYGSLILFLHSGARIPRVLRGSTRVKSYNLVISLSAPRWAHLILAEVNGSFREHVALRLPTGLRPGGFSVFGADFSISNIFSENNFTSLSALPGGGIPVSKSKNR